MQDVSAGCLDPIRTQYESENAGVQPNQRKKCQGSAVPEAEAKKNEVRQSLGLNC